MEVANYRELVAEVSSACVAKDTTALFKILDRLGDDSLPTTPEEDMYELLNEIRLELWSLGLFNDVDSEWIHDTTTIVADLADKARQIRENRDLGCEFYVSHLMSDITDMCASYSGSDFEGLFKYKITPLIRSIQGALEQANA